MGSNGNAAAILTFCVEGLLPGSDIAVAVQHRDLIAGFQGSREVVKGIVRRALRTDVPEAPRKGRPASELRHPLKQVCIVILCRMVVCRPGIVRRMMPGGAGVEGYQEIVLKAPLRTDEVCQGLPEVPARPFAGGIKQEEGRIAVNPPIEHGRIDLVEDGIK